MKQKLFKILKIIIPLGIGIYLTWYFYNGLTPEQKDNIPKTFASANYFWIFLSVSLSWISHFCRAYRWKFLLEPIGYKPRISNLYHSVMIGYIINFTVPRSGEFARAGFLSNKESLSFDKVFGTIVAERVVDVIMLGFITIITFYLVGKDEIYGLMVNPDSGESTPWLLYVLIGVAVVSVVVLVASAKLRKIIIDKVKGVFEGVFSILKLKKSGFFILHTLIIWSCYVLMFWVFGFSMESIQSLDAKTLFACFFVGSTAIAITPGGIGLFIIFVTAAMINIGGYSDESSSSFAVMLWVVQTIFLVLFGLYSLFAINTKFNASEIESQKKLDAVDK